MVEMEEVIIFLLPRAMKVAAEAAALAEMGVLSRPKDLLEAVVAEALVETAGMLHLRTMKHLVVEAVVAVESDHAEPREQSQIWAMGAMIRTMGVMEMDMVSRLALVQVQAVILEEARRVAAAAELV